VGGYAGSRASAAPGAGGGAPPAPGPPANPPARDWFRPPAQPPAGEVVFSDPQSPPGGGPPLFDVASPVYRFDGRLLGIIRFQWDPSSVSELAAAAAGPGQRVDVVSRSGLGFASSQLNSVGVSRADREPFRLSRQQASGTVDYNVGGETLLAAFARVANPPHVQGLDWAVVVEEREDQALAPVFDLQKQVALLLVLSLLAIAGAALF